MAQSIYQQAITSPHVAVSMDEIRTVFWSERNWLLTDALNSCTGVAIVSPQAAILAHIGPNPEANPDTIREKAMHIANHYNSTKEHFPEARSCVIVAVYDGQLVQQGMVNAICSALTEQLLPIKTKAYPVLGLGRARPRGFTSFVISSNGDGNWPSVYVNDEIVDYGAPR